MGESQAEELVRHQPTYITNDILVEPSAQGSGNFKCLAYGHKVAVTRLELMTNGSVGKCSTNGVTTPHHTTFTEQF